MDAPSLMTSMPPYLKAAPPAATLRSLRGRPLAILVIAFGFALSSHRSAAQVQPPGFPMRGLRPGQNMGRDPAEAAAFSSAIGQPELNAQISALQQFLITYPNSSFRPQAIQQLMQAKRQLDSQPQPPAVNRAAPPPPSAPAAAPSVIEQAGPPRDSLLTQSPKRAEITVGPHALAIKADNSTLSQILHEIASSTGMKIDGLSAGKDERIFGSYGPGDAHEVLLALLEGSGYNVVMVGDDNGGVPRELTLTPRAAATAAAGTARAVSNAEEETDDDEVQQAPPPEPQQPPVQTVPGNLQPNENGQPPRTPQEILQELRQRQQQQQLNQPQ